MNRLKELREEAMLTLRELSERSGVSTDTITKIENGHRVGRGTTLRKLAKTLGVEPYVLSPEKFQPRAGVGTGTVGAGLDFSGNPRVDTARAESPEAEPKGDQTLAGILRALDVVKEVEEQSGLGDRHAHFKSLTEEQQLALLTVVWDDGAQSPSALAERLGCSVSAANRDLAILGEYGLVSRDESGASQATPLGKGVASVLEKGGLHYDEALRHIKTLMDAYEPVARIELRELAGQDPNLYFWMQESVVRLIGRFADAAEPSPLARKWRERPSKTAKEPEKVRDRTDA